VRGIVILLSSTTKQRCLIAFRAKGLSLKGAGEDKFRLNMSDSLRAAVAVAAVCGLIAGCSQVVLVKTALTSTTESSAAPAQARARKRAGGVSIGWQIFITTQARMGSRP